MIKKRLYLVVFFIVAVLLVESRINTSSLKLELTDKWLDINRGDSRYIHAQGVAVDDNYIWYSKSNSIVRVNKLNPDWNNPLADNYQANGQGTTIGQINGIHIYGNLLYASGIYDYTEVKYSYIKWYDKMTLEFLGEKRIEWTDGDTPESVTLHNGYWWVVLWTGQVVQYDADFKMVKTYKLPIKNNLLADKVTGVLQGMEWVGENLLIGSTNNLRLYKYDGEFKLETFIKYPKGIQYGQGISIDGDSFYIANYQDAESGDKAMSIDNLYKYTIKGVK